MIKLIFKERFSSARVDAAKVRRFVDRFLAGRSEASNILAVRSIAKIQGGHQVLLACKELR